MAISTKVNAQKRAMRKPDDEHPDSSYSNIETNNLQRFKDVRLNDLVQTANYKLI